MKSVKKVCTNLCKKLLMTIFISYLFLIIYHFLEIIHESANSIYELNDFQVIRTVSNGQVQKSTSSRVTNKDDDFEKTFSPQNKNASQENAQKICKKMNKESSYLQENQENTSISSVESGESYKLICRSTHCVQMKISSIM